MEDDIAITIENDAGTHQMRVLLWPSDNDLTVVWLRRNGSLRNSPKQGAVAKEMQRKLLAMFPNYEMIWR